MYTCINNIVSPICSGTCTHVHVHVYKCTCYISSLFSQSDESAHTAANPCFEIIAFEVELFLKSQFQRLFSINYFRFLLPTKS